MAKDSPGGLAHLIGDGSRLSQIQLALDAAQDFIVDPAFIAEANYGLALDAHGFEGKAEMTIVFGRVVPAPGAGLETGQALAVVPDQIVIDRGGLFGVPLFGVLQMRDGGFGDNATGFPFLAVWTGGAGKRERADQGRERDALQYQGDENHAKG